MVLTNLATGFFRIKKHCTCNGASRSELSGLKLLRTKLKKKTLQNYASIKEIELMGI